MANKSAHFLAAALIELIIPSIVFSFLRLSIQSFTSLLFIFGFPLVERDCVFDELTALLCITVVKLAAVILLPFSVCIAHFLASTQSQCLIVDSCHHLSHFLIAF